MHRMETCISVAGHSLLSPNKPVSWRCRQMDGRRVHVPRPLPIHIYNRFMGGVDKNDQLRGYYSVRIKSRKSYKYLFWFLFNLAVVNSFILYCLSTATGERKRSKTFCWTSPPIHSYNSRKYRGWPHTESACPQRMHVPHYPTKTAQGQCRMSSKHGKRGMTSWWCSASRGFAIQEKQTPTAFRSTLSLKVCTSQ